MINWPAIIKHVDDDELTYISSQSEWDGDADLHYYEYDDSDYLVDSSAMIYGLTKRFNNSVKPESRDRSIELQDILGLIRAHAAQKGSCCVAKLYAPTIHEAFKIIESLQET